MSKNEAPRPKRVFYGENIGACYQKWNWKFEKLSQLDAFFYAVSKKIRKIQSNYDYCNCWPLKFALLKIEIEFEVRHFIFQWRKEWHTPPSNVCYMHTAQHNIEW